MPSNPNQLSNPSETSPRRHRVARGAGRVLLERLVEQTPSLESRIDATKGPFIEVGAVPSNPRGKDSLIDLNKIEKRLMTSNINQPQTIETAYRHRRTKELKIISHRDQAPNPRHYKAIGQDFKTIRSDHSWTETPVNDEIDLIADATNLPVPDGSVGALYAIGLHADAKPKFINDEAPRTLETGGVLVIDGIKPEELALDNPYFDTLIMESHGSGEDTVINYAAMRNNLPYQPPRVDATTSAPVS